MTPLLPLLLLASPAPVRHDRVGDSYAAALAIGHAELAALRRAHPRANPDTVAWNDALTKRELTLLRGRLGLSGPPYTDAVGVTSLVFEKAQRLTGRRLAAIANVQYGPRGGFVARYVVNPAKGPFGTVERRMVIGRI